MELGKVRISLPISLSALTGYILYTGSFDSTGGILAAGVFFMACSSGAFNHWQERYSDAKMPRTQNRPIPSGRISATGAFLIAVSLAVIGTLFLLLWSNHMALLISWVTLIFYNLVYTPLKRITAFAVLPGSMVGALPPLIGWAGAGGRLDSWIILVVAAFFFIGQIPHFWLLLLMFGKQYKLAGMPSLNQIFTETQIKHITYTWILTTIASAFLVMIFVFTSRILILLLLVYIFYLLVSVSILVFGKREFKVLPTFYRLNLLYLFMMLFLIADSLLRP